jgi:L-amino acid N-acyltransferase YncA
MQIIEINQDNVERYGFYCSKNKKDEGYQKKLAWLRGRFEEGLRITLLQDEDGTDMGFIEYGPGENAWRPVEAKGYLFIQCIAIMKIAHRQAGNGALLIKSVLSKARQQGCMGVVATCSEGAWMAGPALFQKLGFETVDKRGRFELLVKKFVEAPSPSFIDWEEKQAQYKGWHLLYAHQCPWHAKSVRDLKLVAEQAGIDLKVKEILTAEEARQSPSGYGVFSLLHDGKLLADHYISATRFKNILKMELA